MYLCSLNVNISQFTLLIVVLVYFWGLLCKKIAVSLRTNNIAGSQNWTSLKIRYAYIVHPSVARQMMIFLDNQIYGNFISLHSDSHTWLKWFDNICRNLPILVASSVAGVDLFYPLGYCSQITHPHNVLSRNLVALLYG